ncbi:MAG: DinB family protein [Promethearchaeota archaeon]
MSEACIVQMMIWEFEQVYRTLKQILNEISKEEAQWQPSSHAKTLNTIKQWNMRGTAIGQWNTKGNEWRSAQNLDPISTIEYLVVHLAECKLMYDEYAFRKGNLTWSELQSPAWPTCRDYLRTAHSRLVESLQNLNDNQLEKPVPTTWGELRPVKRIVSGLIHHDAYHLGQIRMLRNLYKMYKPNDARK